MLEVSWQYNIFNESRYLCNSKWSSIDSNLAAHFECTWTNDLNHPEANSNSLSLLSDAHLQLNWAFYSGVLKIPQKWIINRLYLQIHAYFSRSERQNKACLRIYHETKLPCNRCHWCILFISTCYHLIEQFFLSEKPATLHITYAKFYHGIVWKMVIVDCCINTN